MPIRANINLRNLFRGGREEKLREEYYKQLEKIFSGREDIEKKGVKMLFREAMMSPELPRGREMEQPFEFTVKGGEKAKTPEEYLQQMRVVEKGGRVPRPGETVDYNRPMTNEEKAAADAKARRAMFLLGSKYPADVARVNPWSVYPGEYDRRITEPQSRAGTYKNFEYVVESPKGKTKILKQAGGRTVPVWIPKQAKKYKGWEGYWRRMPSSLPRTTETKYREQTATARFKRYKDILKLPYEGQKQHKIWLDELAASLGGKVKFIKGDWYPFGDEDTFIIELPSGEILQTEEQLKSRKSHREEIGY